mmetsp:Transcript_18163/g.46109  ORF Transcript_18163/g.46109 Transcript_18163/m.46109 type:complete len:131 (-) Transcript_18163:145-537(-)
MNSSTALRGATRLFLQGRRATLGWRAPPGLRPAGGTCEDIAGLVTQRLCGHATAKLQSEGGWHGKQAAGPHHRVRAQMDYILKHLSFGDEELMERILEFSRDELTDTLDLLRGVKNDDPGWFDENSKLQK